MWDESREPKLKIVARRVAFEALLASGEAFEAVEVVDMNERREFLGWVEARGAGGEVVRRFFLAGARGVVGLSEILREAGSEAEVTSVVDVNDRGAILALVRQGADDVAVVLTPHGG